MPIARNSIAIKTIAIVFVAFYAVSAVRSLVPGMCATLASLDTESSSDVCCETLGSTHSPTNVSQPKVDFGTCALCNLTESTAKPVSLDTHQKMYASFADDTFHYSFVNDHDAHWDSISHRGPPVTV